MLKTCYKKANSKETFLEMLKESGLSTNIREGRISGVVFSNREFRKTQGFTEERLQGLDKVLEQSRELSRVRGITRERIIRHRE